MKSINISNRPSQLGTIYTVCLFYIQSLCLLMETDLDLSHPIFRCLLSSASLDLLREYLDLLQDRWRIKTLVRDLLMETTTAFLGGTHVSIARCETTLKEPCAELGAKPGLLIICFNDEDEVGLADLHDGLFINKIKGRLIHEPDVKPRFASPQDSII